MSFAFRSSMKAISLNFRATFDGMYTITLATAFEGFTGGRGSGSTATGAGTGGAPAPRASSAAFRLLAMVRLHSLPAPRPQLGYLCGSLPVRRVFCDALPERIGVLVIDPGRDWHGYDHSLTAQADRHRRRESGLSGRRGLVNYERVVLPHALQRLDRGHGRLHVRFARPDRNEAQIRCAHRAARRMTIHAGRVDHHK